MKNLLVIMLVCAVALISFVGAVQADETSVLRQKEQAAFDKLMGDYFTATHGPTGVRGEKWKKVYDKMMADWQKLADNGNYVAIIELADQHLHLDPVANDDVVKAIHLYERAAKLAKTDKEKEFVDSKLRVTKLILAVSAIKELQSAAR